MEHSVAIAAEQLRDVVFWHEPVVKKAQLEQIATERVENEDSDESPTYMQK